MPFWIAPLLWSSAQGVGAWPSHPLPWMTLPGPGTIWAVCWGCWLQVGGVEQQVWVGLGVNRAWDHLGFVLGLLAAGG